MKWNGSYFKGFVTSKDIFNFKISDKTISNKMTLVDHVRYV